jgi:hypothetical protein
MFGKVGVVTTKEKIQAKISNQGATCMVVEYKEYHRDVYRSLNLKSNSIVNSRDIFRLNKTYKEWKNVKTTIFADEEET